MNMSANPKTLALAVSSLLFGLQLVAFGSGNIAGRPADSNCTIDSAPHSITVPPAPPVAPGPAPFADELNVSI